MDETMSSQNSMPTISLAMIVKNEEAVLVRCLNSVAALVDEIIIVDTGSTDKTIELAHRFTENVYNFPWIDDFAAARNYSFSKATKEYILWLDADDVLLSEDRNKFIELRTGLSRDVDAVSMLYNLEVTNDGRVVSQLRRNRLVKRDRGFRWIGSIHEYLEVYGNVLASDIAITHAPLKHDADRNLLIYEKRLQKGEVFTPRDLYYFANELYDHQLYSRAVEYYQYFLATGQGWVEDNIGACGKLADCFYHLKDVENQLKYILKSFEYDVPRAEFCCRLGYYYLQIDKPQQAAFWYKLATQLERPESWGLMNNNCWTWLPHLQLCVCYSRLGKYQLAYEHNERAAEYIPDDARVIHNRSFLKQMLGI